MWHSVHPRKSTKSKVMWTVHSMSRDTSLAPLAPFTLRNHVDIAMLFDGKTRLDRLATTVVKSLSTESDSAIEHGFYWKTCEIIVYKLGHLDQLSHALLTFLALQWFRTTQMWPLTLRIVGLQIDRVLWWRLTKRKDRLWLMSDFRCDVRCLLMVNFMLPFHGLTSFKINRFTGHGWKLGQDS